MKPLYICAAVLTSVGCGAYDPGAPVEELDTSTDPVVFGTDNRVEYPNITDPRLKQRADQTAGLFATSNISCSGNTCNLTFLPPFTSAPTQTATRPLCNGVRFRNQLTGAS